MEGVPEANFWRMRSFDLGSMKTCWLRSRKAQRDFQVGSFCGGSFFPRD